MSLLDGEIATLFGEVFGAIYLDGTHSRVTRTEDPASAGNIIETASSQACRVQVDACTERQKLEQGYSARDVRLLVLQSGLDGAVRNGDRITTKGKTWIAGPTVTEDPASSYWEIRGIPTGAV